MEDKHWGDPPIFSNEISTLRGRDRRSAETKTDKNIPVENLRLALGKSERKYGSLLISLSRVLAPRGVDTHIYAYIDIKGCALPTGTTSALAFASHSLYVKCNESFCFSFFFFLF